MAISYRAIGDRMARSAGAILGGLLLIVGTYGFFFALALADRPGGWTPSFYDGAMSGGLLMAGIMSGRAAAVLAPRRPSLHTGTLGTIVFALLYFHPINNEIAMFVPAAIIVGGALSKRESSQLFPSREELIGDMADLHDRLELNGFHTSAAHLEDVMECLVWREIDEARCLDALESVRIESRNFAETERRQFRRIHQALIAIIGG